MAVGSIKLVLENRFFDIILLVVEKGTERLNLL